jgi:hypothetical protein
VEKAAAPIHKETYNRVRAAKIVLTFPNYNKVSVLLQALTCDCYEILLRLLTELGKKGLWRQGISFDLSNENMTESVVSSFNERENLSGWRKIVDLKKIDRIPVFESDRWISETVLPDGEDPH